MKKLFLLFFFFYLTDLSYSQGSMNLSQGDRNAIYKKTVFAQDGTTVISEIYAGTGSGDVGFIRTANTLETHRVVAWWPKPYNLPENAVNIKVTLKIQHGQVPDGTEIPVLLLPASSIPAGKPTYSQAFNEISGSQLGTITKTSSNGSNIDEFDITAQFKAGQQIVAAAVEGTGQIAPNCLFFVTVIYDKLVWFSAKNSFPGGVLKIGTAGIDTPCPVDFNAVQTGTSVTLEAVDQIYDNHLNIWNSNCEWCRINRDNKISTRNIYSKQFTFTVSNDDNQTDYTAYYKTVFKASIGNSIADRSDVGTIRVNGVSQQSPYTVDVVQNANPQITVEALPMYEYDNIIYYFKHWESNGQNVSSNCQYTFTGWHDETIRAKYIGFPDKPFGLHVESTGPGVSIGIGIAWNEYPNVNVSKYQIFRNISEKKGSGGEYGFLAEVPRGTTYYTDNGLCYDANGNLNVCYRVLPYYAPDYNYAHEDLLIHYVYTSGSGGGYVDKKNFAEKKELEYKLGNYPNPFNPATKILFGIKKDDFVSIQVFDILGNKICDLVKDFMEAGNHEILFDGSTLPSGFYIYTIKAGSYVETKKMMLLK